VFIHIGGDTMVRMKDIIGIFDIHVQTSPYTARFIEYAKHNDAIEVVEVGDIKSFVVTEKKLYYSPISSLTLKKRANILDHGGKADSESV
jgi:extracellular matrix regulatory protein B